MATAGDPTRAELASASVYATYTLGVCSARERQFGRLVPELTAEENVALPLLLGGARRAGSAEKGMGWFQHHWT